MAIRGIPMPRLTRAGLATAFTNVSLAAMFLLFAYAHLLSFSKNPRPSVVFIVVIETLLGIFLLVRNSADQASSSSWDWMTTIGGTFGPLFLRPIAASDDVAGGQVVQIIGLLLAIYGIASLNRSFGLIPAHRGIKTTGLYRWVRHPLYSAYTVNHGGYLISNFSAYNVAVVLMTLLLQIVRIFNEERFLARYRAYTEYAERTRWRLLPYVF